MTGLLAFLRGHADMAAKEEELLYEFVATELEQGTLAKGLWTKALADAQFDAQKARGPYVKARVSSLRNDFRQAARTLAEQRASHSRLEELLDQGCDQEAIDYLGSPILASRYAAKYRVSVDKINKAISMRRIKGIFVGKTLWVQDVTF